MNITDPSFGNSLKVDKANRAHTYSVIINAAHQATEDGDSYIINSGIITLTNAVDTPIIYVKNNENQNLHISGLVVGAKASVGGLATDMPELTVIRNPTVGTIISSAVAADIVCNRNFGSSNTLTVDSYKGATGDTMTDGVDHVYDWMNVLSRVSINVDEVIPKGSSIGVKLKPPASNTSLPVFICLMCHLESFNTDGT